LWPRNIALALASVVLIGGAWAALRWPRGTAEAFERQQIEIDRERLFSALAALDETHRRGAVDERRYAEQREELVAALTRMYKVGADETVR
jgi:hypothetical protein